MKTIAEKSGIDLQAIKNLKKQKDYKLSDFTRFRILKTEGSSEEILEWKDSFIQPLDSFTLNKYYQDPQLFYEDAVRNMTGLFLPICGFYGKYSESVVQKRLDKWETAGALLTALHLFFYTCDIIWKYDRLLESREARVSPLGMIYQDIREIIQRAAERQGYDEVWTDRTARFLFSSPDYESPYVRLLSDCASLIRNNPSLQMLFEKGKNKEEILSKIEEQPDVLEEVKRVAKTHLCDPWGIADIILSLNSHPQLLEVLKEQRMKGAQKIQGILEEIKPLLMSEEFEELRKARNKLTWFMDLQETNEIIISKNRMVMGSLGLLLTAIEQYFQENLGSLVKKEHQDEIGRIVSSLLQNNLPHGQYYFLPSLRKLTYELIKLRFVRDEYMRIYEREIKLWL